MRGLCGRADLLYALAQGGEELLQFTATILDFFPVSQPMIPEKKTTEPLPFVGDSPEPPPQEETSFASDLIPFWQLVKRDSWNTEKKRQHEWGETGGGGRERC